MPSVGFDSAILAIKWPQTYALDCRATWIGRFNIFCGKYCSSDKRLTFHFEKENKSTSREHFSPFHLRWIHLQLKGFPRCCRSTHESSGQFNYHYIGTGEIWPWRNAVIFFWTQKYSVMHFVPLNDSSSKFRILMYYTARGWQTGTLWNLEFLMELTAIYSGSLVKVFFT